MDNVTWAKVRDSDKVSWHIVSGFTRVPGRSMAPCGKMLTTEPVDNRPEGKTCESCLRIVGPQ